MPSDQNTNKIIELIEPIVAEEGCDLVDVELLMESGQRILRVYINKVGGVNVDDCATVSRAIEDILEVENVVAGQYVLEVSSPGLNRSLRKLAHFKDVVGKIVKIQTHEKINGRQNYKGVLQNVDDNAVTVEIDLETFQLPFAQIRKANLVVS